MNLNDLEIPGPDTAADPSIDANESAITAWEEIAPGRFMPRRVRGSCKGRVLG